MADSKDSNEYVAAKRLVWLVNEGRILLGQCAGMVRPERYKQARELVARYNRR